MCKPSTLFACAALICPAPLPAAAQWAPATSCDQDAGYELENCLKDAIASADASLNAAYRKALSAIEADDQTSVDDKASWTAELQAAERAWIAFRDANCKFELIGAEWHDGSGTTSAQQACVLAMTLQRADELTRRYSAN